MEHTISIKDINLDELRNVPGVKIVLTQYTEIIRHYKNTQAELRRSLEAGDGNSPRLVQELGNIRKKLDNCNETILAIWRQQHEPNSDAF